VSLSTKDLVDGLPRVVALRDAPLALASDLALHSLAKEVGGFCKVVLSGEGADELLGGYRRYVAARYFPSVALRSHREALQVLAPDFPREKGKVEKRPEGNTYLRKLLTSDQSGWLADNLLERGERIAAAAGLELRLPFLDQRLTEYVAA